MTILAFMLGMIIAGCAVALVGELVFGGSPYRGPTWFIYAAAGAALGTGWGAAEWARSRFINSSPSQKKAISSIVGLTVIMCGVLPAGKIVGNWAADFGAMPREISQADRADIINLVRQQCEFEAPRKVVFQGARASRVSSFCQCYGDAVGTILTRADADFIIEKVSMPTALEKRTQDLGIECLKRSGVL
ncbi:hypothetical protein [Bradyrhizobium sp. SEMIA]|uniref:hypothetical protein n=1 Tax=Bradyrhizobium sp. SEMIA TaxID=2597515 RepID=UPI0018A5B80A|nr:hypothetical protein [Bradyrhizobium sp. SEMIA]QOG20577.1 hypothetical protein FOM02_27720 [Bradyrhizobium sp. SEMIA]